MLKKGFLQPKARLFTCFPTLRPSISWMDSALIFCSPKCNLGQEIIRHAMTAGTIPAPAVGFPPITCSSATLSKKNWPFLFQVSAGRVAVLGAQEGPEAAATLVQRGSRSLTPPDFSLNLSCARCSSYLGSLFFSWKSKGRRRMGKNTNELKPLVYTSFLVQIFPFCS